MEYVIGIDGGGTKTTAAVIREDLGRAGSATTGPANYRSVGMEAASANIANAVLAALRAADVTLSEVRAICMCLAGFDTDLDLPVPQRAMQLLNYNGVAIMENDVVGAWSGATEAGPGIVVIAGTGSTGLGMNARGQLWRTDGWDYILGDYGSAYAIGHEAIRTAMKALDGRIAPTRLALALRDAYGVTDAESMRRLVDSTSFGKVEISAFAAHVSRAADAGDSTAQDLLARAGQDLGDQASAIIQHLHMGDDAFPISTVGSVFKSTPWVTDPFYHGIRLLAPRAVFRPPLHAPEVGAAILALRRLRDNDTGSWTLGTGSRHIQRSLRIDELGLP
ncbi:MAG TPA: BadF/BadG/BcrA/BcrD ATPase family protein [Ktedonobacterales bacterium]|nr:BadF/BadG/BcrA/BcrD ATPase family protein [Ktedonobacterales bacterium]